MFCFTGLCQSVSAAMGLAVEVVSGIMNLEIMTQQQLLFEPADANESHVEPADDSAADAVPSGEEIPVAVEVGKQSAVTTWYACLTNCNIRTGIRKTSSMC